MDFLIVSRELIMLSSFRCLNHPIVYFPKGLARRSYRLKNQRYLPRFTGLILITLLLPVMEGLKMQSAHYFEL